MSGSSGSRTGTNAKAVIDGVLVLRVTQWSITVSAGETAWGDSDSAGFTNRVLARRDATASLTGKFDTNKKFYTLFEDGEQVKLVLWEDAADYWSFPCALVQGFNVTYNQDTKEVVEWSADFGSDGPFYRPGHESASGETIPA